MPVIKEPHYLCSHHFPVRFSGPGDQGFSDNVVRSEEAYLRLYANAGRAEVLGDASVYYLYYPDTAERIQRLNPDAKVIIILRNPVDRAFSAYSHTVRDGRESLSFEEALTAEEKRRQSGYQPLWWYKEVGMYAKQVERYLKVFDRQHLRIFLYEDMQDTNRLVREILSFLRLNPEAEIDTSIRYNASGIPKSRWLYNFFAQPNVVKAVLKPFLPKELRTKLGNKAKNMTLQHITLRPETRYQLMKEYQEDVAALEALIGRDLSHWLREDAFAGVETR